MGATGTYGNFKNAEEFFKSEFDNLFGKDNVVDYYINNYNPNYRKATCYVAFRNSENQVMACIITVRRYRTKGYEDELIYKAVTETMGPCDTKCPKRILNQLDEPINEWASEWREKCKKVSKSA